MNATTAAAEATIITTRITRQDNSFPILITTGMDTIAIRAGTIIEIDGRINTFAEETPIGMGELMPGRDYAVDLDFAGMPYVRLADGRSPEGQGWLAGFHFAPGGNAAGKEGGDTIPAINPFSLWDIGFRPACADPRGMTLVAMPGGKSVWVDIYLLGVDHLAHGTSICSAMIADGKDLPDSPDGNGKVNKLDYATAVAIYAHHGKRLLGADEFFAAAYGVKERRSHGRDQKVTGSLSDNGERFISRFGLFDVTGTMWQWGTDGHPDDPRPSIFGGSWVNGGNAGSRYAHLGYWGGHSDGLIGARGACDHLSPA